ncbi:MAG: lysine--tRNA ligase, partial [Acidimicrobiaceae bacterium]
MTDKSASQEQAVDHKSEAERASGFEIERSRRINAVNELRGSGSNPYPYRFDRTHTLGELRETFA